jgi:hypothetical protein
MNTQIDMDVLPWMCRTNVRPQLLKDEFTKLYNYSSFYKCVFWKTTYVSLWYTIRFYNFVRYAACGSTLDD